MFRVGFNVDGTLLSNVIDLFREKWACTTYWTCHFKNAEATQYHFAEMPQARFSNEPGLVMEGLLSDTGWT